MTTNPLMARFVGEPALIEPGMIDRVEASLDAVMAHEFAQQALVSAAASNDEFWTELGPRATKMLRPYVVKEGILFIPIKGALLKDFPYQFFDMATGYEYIRAAFDRGLNDNDVKGIALVVDSPGGMVAGNFDLVDHIFAARGRKPIMGYADEHAYSAAYSIISSADPGRVKVARTGGAGSIGVVTYHLNLSGMMEQIGVERTWLFKGKHKVDGHPDGPLPDDVKARIENRLEGLYEVFVSTVARNRGMDAQKVRDTEALTFTATQAVSEGLADSIGSLDDAVVAFAADLSSTSGDDEMSNKDNTAVDQAAQEAAVATAREEGRKTGLAEGAAAQLARINAILGSDAGKARPKAALSAALKSSMTAEEANAFLADLPEEKPAAEAPGGEATDFNAAMERGNPEVGAATGKKKEGDDEQADIVASLGSLGVIATPK